MHIDYTYFIVSKLNESYNEGRSVLGLDNNSYYKITRASLFDFQKTNELLL